MVNWERIIKRIIIGIILILILGFVFLLERTGSIKGSVASLKAGYIALLETSAEHDTLIKNHNDIIYGNDSIKGLVARLEAVEQFAANNEDSISLVKQEMVQINKEASDVRNEVTKTTESLTKANKRITSVEKAQKNTDVKVTSLERTVDTLKDNQAADARKFLESELITPSPPPPPAPEPEANASGVKNGQWGHPSNYPLKSATVEEPIADGATKRHWRVREREKKL